MKRNRPVQNGPAAVRLTFTYEDEKLRLSNARRLTMRAPRGDRFEKERDDRIGTWVEVQGSDGEVLYRRRIRQVDPDDVEVHRGGEEGTFERVPRGKPVGLVNVLIPDLEGAERVVLRERRPARGKREKPREIEHASVSLREIDVTGAPDESRSSGAQ